MLLYQPMPGSSGETGRRPSIQDGRMSPAYVLVGLPRYAHHPESPALVLLLVLIRSEELE